VVIKPVNVIVPIVALALVFPGCASDPSDLPGGAIAHYDVVAPGGDGEYAFDLPSEPLQAGALKLRLTNKGALEHQITAFQMKPNVTGAEFIESYLANPDFFSLLKQGEPVSGPNAVAAGEDGEVVLDLAQGEYVFMCLIPDADGLSHAQKGMVAPVTVGEPAEPEALAVPTAKVSLVDFGFSGPTEYSTGEVVEVTNNGTQSHELTIYHLDDGMSVDEFIANGAVGLGAGGATSTRPDERVQITMPTEAGRYALICFVPNAEGEPVPHFALGMKAEITVEVGAGEVQPRPPF
jgi:uncharacterized cupredoxin-like copper-binding protein